MTDRNDSVTFNVGELRMVQLHRRGYLSNWWTPVEKFTEFCSTTVQLAIENLVFNNVLTFTPEDTGIKILFLRLSNISDLLFYTEIPIDTNQFGILERLIIRDVMKRPGRPAADYIHALHQELLPENSYRNPGRELIAIILGMNLFNYWESEYKKNLLRVKIDLTITPLQEEQMVSALNIISKPVIVARNQNKEFRLFSERLYNHAYSQLATKVEDTSG